MSDYNDRDISGALQKGSCKFCGQIADIPLIGIMTKVDADDYASRNCNCFDGKRHREQLELREKLAQEREDTLKRATLKIEHLCGEGAENYGVRPVDEEIKQILNLAAVFCYDGLIKNVTVGVTAATKVKIDKSAKGILQIHRSDVAAFKHEV